MCGIAGLLPYQRTDSLTVMKRMLERMERRGPDDEGLWVNDIGSMVLGHRRLSVIETSSRGHQPMLSEDGAIAVTYNGEIYNSSELREELLKLGKTFRTCSDTEVLIKGYEVWGTSVLNQLVGMFAFGLWDSRKNLLFLARDRLGEKPLYYGVSKQGFAFASEIAAIREVPWFSCSVDADAVAMYLRYQYIPAPMSIYREISKLPPAHAMTVQDGHMRIWRYWDPLDVACKKEKITENQALDALEHLLREVLRSQVTSDVPVGAFLSGGIDSSLVVSFMSEVSSKPVQTFTVGFEASEFNEAGHAEAVARYIGANHIAEILKEKDAVDLVQTLPLVFGEPFADSSAIPSLLVSSLAKRHVTVVLSGDGGDECFGGYKRYAWLEYGECWLPALVPIAFLARMVQERLPKRIARIVSLIGKPSKEIYRTLMCPFSENEVLRLTGKAPTIAEYERVWSSAEMAPVRRTAMVADLVTYLPDDILVKVDRTAMFNSLESRSPFLDHRVVEFGLSLPVDLVKNKRLLKQLAYKRIPRYLLDRPKQGFAAPIGRWLRGRLSPLLYETLMGESLCKAGLSDKTLIKRLVSEHVSGHKDHSHQLWILLVLGLWSEHWL